MILQALEYEMGECCNSFAITLFGLRSFSFNILNPITEHGKVLDEFFISTAGRLNSLDVIWS